MGTKWLSIVITMLQTFTGDLYKTFFVFFCSSTICTDHGTSNTFMIILPKFWRNHCKRRNKQYLIWKHQYSAFLSQKYMGVALSWGATPTSHRKQSKIFTKQKNGHFEDLIKFLFFPKNINTHDIKFITKPWLFSKIYDNINFVTLQWQALYHETTVKFCNLKLMFLIYAKVFLWCVKQAINCADFLAGERVLFKLTLRKKLF